MNRYAFTRVDAEFHADLMIKIICENREIKYENNTIYLPEGEIIREIIFDEKEGGYFMQMINSKNKNILSRIYVFTDLKSYDIMIIYLIGFFLYLPRIFTVPRIVLNDSLLITYFKKCGFGSNYRISKSYDSVNLNHNFYDKYYLKINDSCPDQIYFFHMEKEMKKHTVSYKRLFSGSFLKEEIMSKIFEKLESDKKLFVQKLILFKEYIYKDLFQQILEIGFVLNFGLGCKIL